MDDYYINELAQSEGQDVKFKFHSENGESKWLNLNPESIAALREFLNHMEEVTK